MGPYLFYPPYTEYGYGPPYPIHPYFTENMPLSVKYLNETKWKVFLKYALV